MEKNSKARWGNKFGATLIPVFHHKGGNNPLQYLKRAKVMNDKKKHSMEAYFTCKIRDLVMTLLGPKVQQKKQPDNENIIQQLIWRY